MNVTSIDIVFRCALLLGTVIYFLLIFWLLKHDKLSVRYSLVWLTSGAVLLLFAICPYIVFVLRDLLNMEMPQNVVFMLVLFFVLLVLLSLSVAVSKLTEHAKRLTQANALLENRIRALEKERSDNAKN